MQKQTIQLATVVKNGVIQKVGNSSIYHSSIQYDGRKTKWFDDSKLIHKKSSIDSSQLPIEK
ncbi:hypothetical protein DWW33_04120 [Roseburia sp. AF15-21]|uniref:hypothetical protein n=1 Tax=Roseburia sp. AF15-21 TaxID=2293128 RepID=UPI000E5301C6|nr:hypothetical protein [Roseburia sp. AF15-21]RHR89447.1 hypothetical protein DWW33_04120 [Roseburia sp. AF15-21]